MLKLKPDSSNSRHLLGRIERFRGNITTAIRHFKQANKIDPDDAENLLWLSWHFTLFAGKPTAAEPYVNKSIKIDPLTPPFYWPLAFIHLMKKEFGPAITLLRKVYKMAPDIRWSAFFLAQFLARNKQFEKAYELIDQTVREDSQDMVAVMSLFFKYALHGEKEKALQTITEDCKSFMWNDPECPWWIAGGYALLNEREEALYWIERAIDRGWINYPLFNEIDPFLENISLEERFKKLMERVKHEWENFEV